MCIRDSDDAVASVEVERDVTYFDHCTVEQASLLLDCLTIEERAVAAFEIFEEPNAIGIGDFCVVPANGTIINLDGALRMPSNDDGVSGKPIVLFDY